MTWRLVVTKTIDTWSHEETDITMDVMGLRKNANRPAEHALPAAFYGIKKHLGDNDSPYGDFDGIRLEYLDDES